MASENTSEEDATKACDSCSFQGKQREAVTHCIDCCENFCQECERFHGSLKATRDHKLEPFQDVNVKANSTFPAVMFCLNHQTEVLAKFCKGHSYAICELCVLTTHRKCTVDCLNDTAKEEGAKTEVAKFIRNIKETISSFEKIKKAREQDKVNIIKCSKNVRQEIERIKVDILNWIEHLAIKTEEELREKEGLFNSEIDNHIKVSDQMLKQLNRVLDSFHKLDDYDQTAKFTTMIKNKPCVEDGKKVKDEILNEIAPVEFKLYRSDNLIKSMSEISNLGKVDSTKLPEIDINLLEITSVTKIKETIEVGKYCVTGCEFMPDGKSILCHGLQRNNTVKVLTPQFEIRDELRLNSSVWDVAAIGPEEVVVTGKESKMLHFLDISKGIELTKSVNIHLSCYGIVFEGGQLYVTCVKDGGTNEVMILNIDGSIIESFSADQGNLYYLAVRPDLSEIMASTDNKSTVQYFDASRTLIHTYTDRLLNASAGVKVDKAGNLLVCGRLSNNVLVVKENGLRQKVLLTSRDGLDAPCCLAYRPSDKTFIIGQCASPFLLNFKIK